MNVRQAFQAATSPSECRQLDFAAVPTRVALILRRISGGILQTSGVEGLFPILLGQTADAAVFNRQDVGSFATLVHVPNGNQLDLPM